MPMTENATLNYKEAMLKPSQKVLDFIFSYAAAYETVGNDMIGRVEFMKN
jgi:hypothetical protein